MLFRCHKSKQIMLLWRNEMTRQFKGVVKLTSRKEMVTIILAVQIVNEKVRINNSISKKKTQEKTKWLANYLFFISMKIIVRKQILLVTNMCYNAQPVIIVYPQPNTFI